MEPSLATILMERRKELRHDYAPMFFRLSSQEDKERMHALLQEHPNCSVVDNLHLQLRDLVKLENPSRTLTEVDYSELIAQKLGVIPSDEYGVWIYFSWKDTLVHWLDEEDFIAVRTVRNKYKITQEEQDILKAKRVGVIGLSVGHAAAMSLAMERIGGEIRIADFDRLELSNMNRIRTSGLNLDLPKTVIVAREIAEIDPFIKVTCYSEGITEDNIDAFLTEGGKLDALVEECDGIDIKFLARERCRHFRIPVVMETSDRGMLDIERYDLDGEYPLFHGLVDTEVSYEFLKSLKTSEEKLPYVLPIVGSETISTRFKASLLEVGQTITTWPQLAGEVSMGGAVCAIVVRGILCGGDIHSRRCHVDSSSEFSLDVFQKPELLVENELALPQLKEMINGLDLAVQTCRPDVSTIQNLVRHAMKASSPGNMQKWRWLWFKGHLFLFIDKHKELGFADNFSFGSIIGFGMALHHMRLKAGSIGLGLKWTEFDTVGDNFQLVAKINFEASGSELSSLQNQLLMATDKRTTDRGEPRNGQIELSSLEEALNGLDVNVLNYAFIRDSEEIQRIGQLIRKGDRMRLMNRKGHADFFGNELRWNAEQAEKSKDGLDVHTLNLTRKKRAGLELACDGNAIDFVRRLSNSGRGFEEFSKSSLESSSAVVVFFVKSLDRRSLLRSGEELDKFWLECTNRNIGVHPLTVLQMLFSYLEDNKRGYMPVAELNEVEALKIEFDRIFPAFSKMKSVFTVRLFPATTHKNPTRRREVDTKLDIIND